MNRMENSSNTTNDDLGDCYPSMNPKNIFIALHLTVILIGIPSNVFFLCMSSRLIRQKNDLGVYLVNLALSDLLFIACLPIWIQSGLNDSWPYGQITCVVCVFLLFTHFYTSIVLLSCVAVDRYLAIVHPLKFSELRNRRIASIVSAGAWIFTIMFNAITLRPAYVYEERDSTCLDKFPIPEDQRWVNMARFVIGFLIPILVVGFCYWRISLEIRKNQTLEATERRQACMLLGAIFSTLFLCFGPSHIMMVLRYFYDTCPYPDWLFIGYKVSVFLSMLNCLADPFLYGFTSKTGQASAVSMLAVIRRTWKKEEEGKKFDQNDDVHGTGSVSMAL